MQYHSTRNTETLVSPAEAILQGLSPDGGLYIFSKLPQLDPEAVLSSEPMAMSARILEAFFPDLPEVEELVRRAYEGKFDAPDLVPTVPVGPYQVLELFHGPTSAFKDVALCLLPHLMGAAKKVTAAKTGEKDLTLHVLTATSGDTGKAALSGFADVPGTMITVFYPHGGVSAMQRLQMVTQPGTNVHVAGIRGNFDDAQRGVKTLFTDAELEKALAQKGIRLTSANSINIGRLVPQIMYYFKVYADLLKRGQVKMGDPVNFCVPTGNFGDILAGYLAGLLGLPVGKLIIASNKNNVLTDFFHSGTYDRRRKLYTTVAPSMDILVSSNLERLLFLLSGCDPALTAAYMKELSEGGSYSISPQLHSALKDSFLSDYATDRQAKEMIAKVYQEHHYLMDPHTAIAWAVAERYTAAFPEDVSPMVVLSTASCYKFPQTVLEALDALAPEDPFEQLFLLNRLTGVPVSKPLLSLQQLPELHPQVIDQQSMKSFVWKEGLNS